MLSSQDIVNEMEIGNISISPFLNSNLGPNSYDVTLGNWFWLLHQYDNGKPVYSGPIYHDIGDTVQVPNNGVLLAMSHEVVGSRNNIVGVMKTRSSIMRMGIDCCKSAGLGDVGYWNHWTMEITSNVMGASLTIGQRVAQIYFDRVETQPNNEYQGQYRIEDWPLCMLPKEFRKQFEGVEFVRR